MRKSVNKQYQKYFLLFQSLFDATKRWVRSKRRPLASEKVITSDKQFLKVLPKNPYLQSRVLWNDMYGSLQVKLENSYRIILILSIVIGLAIIGFIIVAGESKVKPYVTVIHGDEVLTLDQSTDRELQVLHPKLAPFFTKNFIRYVRNVSADGEVNAQNKIAAYALVAGAATERLKTFYQKNNPDTIARHAVKTIQITSVLRVSAHTIEVRWKEAWHDVRSDKLRRTQRYIAQVTYQFQQPSQNQHILRINPLGFYITHLSWSEDQYS